MARLNSFTPGLLCCQMTDKDNYVAVNCPDSTKATLTTKVGGTGYTIASQTAGGVSIETGAIRLEYDPATGLASVYRNFTRIIQVTIAADKRPPVTSHQGFIGGKGVRTMARFAAFEAF